LPSTNGPVRHLGFAAVQAQRGGGLRRHQTGMPDDLVRVRGEPLPDPAVGPVPLGVVHRRQVRGQLFGVDEHQHVLHRSAPFQAGICAMRRISSSGATSSTCDATVQPCPNGSTMKAPRSP
jgi:hypothetical protein